MGKKEAINETKKTTSKKASVKNTETVKDNAKVKETKVKEPKKVATKSKSVVKQVEIPIRKTNKTLISIITTFYNAEKFIYNTLSSINQQIVTDAFDYEYVIVDDKSPDTSRQITEDFIKTNVPDEFKYRWHIYEPDENLGCGGARKFGIEHAIGDYFMFLDADDYYMHTNFLKKAYETLIAEDADVVEYGVLFNQTNGERVNNTASQKLVIENNPGLAELAIFRDNIIKFNVWSKIYKRWVVESYPYSTSRTYEDVRTIPVWISNARKIVIMPETEINYRAATGSIIRNNVIDTRIGTITAIAELFPRFKDNYQVLKAMYGRAMVDLEAMLHNHSSNNDGFNQMSRLNTIMLSYLYPKTYKQMTYHIEDDENIENRPTYPDLPNVNPLIENIE